MGEKKQHPAQSVRNYFSRNSPRQCAGYISGGEWREMMDVGKSKSTVNEEKERFIYRGTKRQAGYARHGNYARPNYNGSYVYGNNK